MRSQAVAISGVGRSYNRLPAPKKFWQLVPAYKDATRDRYEDLVIHCPRRALSHQHAGGHERRLQEQPTRVVRSNVHSAAPH